MKNINLNGIKRILKKGKMTLVPVILATSIVLTGCGKSNTVKLSKEGLTISNSNQGVQFDTYEVYYIDSISDEYIETLEDYSNESICPFTIYCNVSEFGKYVGESNVTYNDIKNTINNIELEQSIKNILLEGINNLEENNFDANLDVLNYNLKNLKVEYVEQIEDKDAVITKSGVFNPCTHSVLLSKEIVKSDNFRRIISHEILGHGMTIAYTEENGGIMCSPSKFYYTNVIKDSKLNNIYNLGETLNEGIADYIAAKSCNMKLNNDLEWYYPVFVQQLEILLKSSDTKESEFINYGVEYLMNNMKKVGVSNPMEYILSFDIVKSCFEVGYDFTRCCKDTNLVEIDLLSEIVAQKIKEGVFMDEINSYVIETIDYSSNIINLMDFEGHKGIYWSNGVSSEFIEFDYLKESLLTAYMPSTSNQKILK